MGNNNMEIINKDDYNNYIVTKSNKLVYANYDLSLNELKIMLILASRVQPDENKFNEYVFRASELAELLQITPEAMYKELPKITGNLMKKTFEIETEDKKNFLQVNLLSSALYRKGEGTVELEFSHKLAPYLLQIKQNFTYYRLENVLVLNSKYSIRMYELFKSHFNSQGPLLITVTDLKKLLKLTQKSYNAYGHLKAKVIDVAVKEINEMTDLTVEWEGKRVGRKVENLYFTIKTKSPHQVTKKSRKIKGKQNPQDVPKTLEKPQVDTKPSPSKRTKKEEPFVDYLQTVVKQKTKKRLLKKDARTIAKLVNEDMKIFCPVLPYLNDKIDNPTGFIVDFIKNPDKYQVAPKIIRKEMVSPPPVQPSMSEEEAKAAVERMLELQAKLLSL